MSGTPDLLISRCGACHSRFLPRSGPCPFCGSPEVVPEPVPPQGRVLAATELVSPSSGWTSPHRLVLVELAQSVRLLGVTQGPLPPLDSVVGVERDGAIYRIVPAPPS